MEDKILFPNENIITTDLFNVKLIQVTEMFSRVFDLW